MKFVSDVEVELMGPNVLNTSSVLLFSRTAEQYIDMCYKMDIILIPLYGKVWVFAQFWLVDQFFHV